MSTTIIQAGAIVKLCSRVMPYKTQGAKVSEKPSYTAGVEVNRQAQCTAAVSLDRPVKAAPQPMAAPRANPAGELPKVRDGMITYQYLPSSHALSVWQPINGHAVLTCEIFFSKSHPGPANEAWEERTYEFQRLASGDWLIDTHPGILRRPSWEAVVEWFCAMRPREIELLTTV